MIYPVSAKPPIVGSIHALSKVSLSFPRQVFKTFSTLAELFVRNVSIENMQKTAQLHAQQSAALHKTRQIFQSLIAH